MRWPPAGCPAPLEKEPQKLAATLDAAARASFEQASAPGAVVGVSSPEGIWTAAYGVADPATGEPMEVGVNTRIGSVTKPFTATLLLQLAEEGRLSLEDPIAVGVSESPLFAPGERFDYSNTNYILLGLVIEQVTGDVERVIRVQQLDAGGPPVARRGRGGD